jgi:hypothetical protein
MPRQSVLREKALLEGASSTPKVLVHLTEEVYPTVFYGVPAVSEKRDRTTDEVLTGGA